MLGISADRTDPFDSLFQSAGDAALKAPGKIGEQLFVVNLGLLVDDKNFFVSYKIDF